MAYSQGNEISRHILEVVNSGELKWGQIVKSVADKVDVHPTYVERELGKLVQNGVIKRVNTAGLPSYTLSASAGAIEGKYKSFTDKRLELEKSGTFEDDPSKQPLTPDKAV